MTEIHILPAYVQKCSKRPKSVNSAETAQKCPNWPKVPRVAKPEKFYRELFLKHPVLQCYNVEVGYIEFGLDLSFFHWPSMQPWVPVESSGHVGIDHASELHLCLQEVDNDQDAVKMNTQRDVKITIVNIDSVDSTP